MELTEIPVTKIRRDPSQPRSAFDDEEIEEMAKSMKTTGLINPIEVDSSGMIITGERRWRAAKKAGLTTIPCKVLVIDPDDRFMRQVIENIHHNTMSDWDTAMAFQKLIASSPHRGIHPKAAKSGPHANRGIEWVAERTGKSRQYVGDKMAILEISKPLQKALQKGNLKSTHLRALHRAPEEHKAAIEKKLLSGELKTSEGGLEIVAALKRNPEKAKEILGKDYSKITNNQDMAVAVSKISPRFTDNIEKAIEPTKQLGNIVTSLIKWMEHNSPDSVGKYNIRRVVLNLTTAQEEIKKWLKTSA